jgi:hypothetical protein
MQFSLRSLMASTTFIAAFLSLAVSNYVACREHWTDDVYAVLESYVSSWMLAAILTGVLLPFFHAMRILWPAITIACACLIAMAINYLLPFGSI